MMEFTHIANPVRVTAIRIEEVTDITNRAPGHGQSSPDLMLRLADGQNYRVNADMTARHVPVAGDYLVRQEDGYVYLNPKDVFERKYRVIGAQMGSKVSGETASNNYGDTDLRNQAMNYASRHYEAGSAAVVKAAEAYYQFLKGGAA